jgi:lipid-A-disaccharide synthase
VSEPLRVLLVAGEASGDLHGAAFVRALRGQRPDVEVSGVGGAELRKVGMEILVDAASVATMGLVETFGTLGRLAGAYRRLVRFLDEQRPRLVVLIDYPEFNLLIARQAKRRGIKVLYFISPQVWAWRPGRVRKIAARVDRLAAVFPFEPALYNQVDPARPDIARFVGHPLLDIVRVTRTRDETLEKYGLDPTRRMLAILPGSRRNELKYLLKPLARAAEILAADGWQPVLALATSVRREDVANQVGATPPFVIVESDTYNIVAAADAAVVKSGTATLETALLGRPMVIVYRAAWPTYMVARALVQVEQIGMPNIILQRSVFPELIQAAAKPEKIAAAVRAVVERSAEMRQAATDLRAKLGGSGAADRAARLALDLVG